MVCGLAVHSPYLYTEDQPACSNNDGWGGIRCAHCNNATLAVQYPTSARQREYDAFFNEKVDETVVYTQFAIFMQRHMGDGVLSAYERRRKRCQVNVLNLFLPEELRAGTALWDILQFLGADDLLPTAPTKDDGAHDSSSSDNDDEGEEDDDEGEEDEDEGKEEEEEEENQEDQEQEEKEEKEEEEKEQEE
jgi:hypothetical protein